MAYMKCPTCGNKCKFDLETGYICDCCGNVYSGEDISDTITAKLDYANSKRREDYDFEAALSTCLEILKDEPNNQEANWCALLAEYQIVYLKTSKGDYKPTFINPEVAIPINKCKYYKKLNVDYRKLADFAEEVRLEVLRESKQIPDYDVFISYKQHVDNSDTIPTEEAEWAAEIYNSLSKTDLRVFYDEVSLKNGTAGWEPHIYSALKSSRYLILLGSSLDNINSTWVKNEWKRFIACRKKDSDKTFTVVGKNFKPEEIDYDLQSKQMLSANDIEWTVSLVKNVTDYFVKYKIDFYLKEAESYILKRKFKNAKQCYAKVCSADQRNVKAYWGLLYCKFRAMDDYDLVKSRKKIGKTIEYKNVIEYATEEEKEFYKKICEDNLVRNKVPYVRTNYNYWKKKYRVQRYVKYTGISAGIIGVILFIANAYTGITHPIKYKVNNGEATLSGKSMYFNWVVKDLKVDTYKNYPVTKIGDGALKNSNIKSIILADSVNEIGDSAFKGCKNLRSINIKNCTFIGSEAFKGCSRLTEIILDINDYTIIKADAFTNIGKYATIYVPSIASELTSELKSYYTSIDFVIYTRNKVEECSYFINKLNKISFYSEPQIEMVETLYNNLSDNEKKLVTNYGILQNAKEAYKAATSIYEIGDITLDNEKKIIDAENTYRSLTTEQKNMVANYDNLLTARAVFNTMSLINKIGDVTISSEQKIVKAEEAYFALNYEQRDLVSNYNILASARTKVDILYADVAIKKIAEIDSIITLDSEKKIIEAETCYNNLTSGQKNRVTNYDILVDARAVYNVTKAIDNIKTITVDSGGDLKIAQNLYNKLTSAQKNKVINYDDLIDAVAVYPVVTKIGSIGMVFANKINYIETAETAYAKLNANQQNKVSNYENLRDSRIAYNTVLLIEKIGSDVEKSAKEINEAQASYEKLTSSQKNIVGNYEILNGANKVYNTIMSIKELGEITLSSSSQISKAEGYYNSLSVEQRQKIYNYEELCSARAIYSIMKSINSLGSVRLGKGSNYSYLTITSSNMVSNLNNATLRNEIDSITLSSLVRIDEQDYLDEAFKNIKYIRYDLTEGSAPNSFCFASSHLTYRIIGAKRTYNINFTADSGDELNLEFDTFNVSTSGTVLDVTKVGQTNIKFLTSTDFIGGNNNISTIDAKGLELNLLSNTIVNITGSDGTSEFSGGIGISATTLKISGTNSSHLNVKGGNGVSGENGINGKDGTAGSGHNGDDYDRVKHSGSNGTDGTYGSSGTSGGNAVNANSIVINNGYYKFTGGNGGNGGKGGNGGNGGNGAGGGQYWVALSWEHYHRAGHGGNGGNGGNGGTGGRGGSAIEIYNPRNNSIWLYNCNLTLEVGKCGNGGDGGSAGKGGNGGDDNWIDCYDAGSGGNGGKSGNGGNYHAEQSRSSLSSMMTYNPFSVKVTYITSEKNGIAGKAGSIGVGGTGGKDYYHHTALNNNGKDGPSGNNGSVFIR